MINGALTIRNFEQRAQGDGAIVRVDRVPVFRFNQRCHPGANLKAEFTQGVIVLNCAGCDAELCRVAVAE